MVMSFIGTLIVEFQKVIMQTLQSLWIILGL